MAFNQTQKIYKLRQAINSKGHRLLFTSTEFFSEEKGRPIAIYHIKDSIKNVETGKYESKELFASPSHLQIIFFLRDYLFTLDGKELPTDNEYWNTIREAKVIQHLPINIDLLEKEE